MKTTTRSDRCSVGGFIRSSQSFAGLKTGIAGVRIVVVLLLALAMASPLLAQDRQDPVKIGVLATRGVKKCLAKWGPTAEYLTSQIPGRSFAIVPLGYEEGCPAVERGKVDFALANSSFYVELEARYGVNRLATLKNLCLGKGYTQFGGVIFQRADREEIKRLADLAGKTFMAVKGASFGGWQMAWRELKEAGIDPYRDFGKLRFGGTHDAVVYAVRDGLVDAGTVRTDTLERMAAEGKIRLEDFRVINKRDPKTLGLPFLCSTRLYPEWSFAKVKHVPDDLAQQVAIALLSMSRDSPAAEAARCTGWTIPQAYQPVRECLKELRVGPYEDFGKITFADVISRYSYWLLAALAVLALMTAVTAWVVRLNRRLAQTQSAACESEERLQTILDTVQAGIVVVDAEEHVIVEANPVALKMIGAPKEQVVGHVYHKYICPAERGRCPITDLGEVVNNSERVLLKADGQAIPVLKTVTSVMLNGRKHLLDSFVDITERKQAEEELRKNIAQLERFNRLAVGREQKMIELKREVNDLLRTLGREEKYTCSAAKIAAAVVPEAAANRTCESSDEGGADK